MIKVVVAGAVVLVVVLIVLVWQFGLFGGSGPSKPRVAAAQPNSQPASQPTQTAAQPAQTTPAPQPATPPTPSLQFVGPNQPSPGQKPPEAEKPAAPEKPPLPEKVADWTAEDYFRARRENNPKLLEAVAYLGNNEKIVGSEPAAKGLTKLLKPLPPEKPAEKPAPTENQPQPGQTPPANPNPASSPLTMQPPGPPKIPPEGAPPLPGATPNNPVVMPGLVEAIITALGNNGSAPARDTIEQVLAGTFKTDDDKTAVEAALKALLAHQCPENNALTLRVLTAPGVLRPSERQGPWPEKEFQAKAFELTKQSATSDLRLALAKALVDHHVQLDPKDPVHEFLLARDPLNCRAQLTFYEKGNPSAELKTTLEEQFLDYGSQATARLLDIPDNLDQPTAAAANPIAPAEPHGGLLGGFADKSGGQLTEPKRDTGQPGGQPAQTAEDKAKAAEEQAARMAAGLWNPKFLALLEPKLKIHAVDSLEKKAKLVMLAGTIPQDSTRSLLNALLRKRWDEGPKALLSVGLADKIVTDPGMYTIIKMLYRKDSKSAKGTPPAPAGGTVNKRIAEAQKRQQMAQEWWDLSAKLAPLWCKRFYAAAQARQSADAGGGDASAQLKLPKGFELSPNARVTASYHLSWPDQAPPEIAALKPGLLDIYYVRLEEAEHAPKSDGLLQAQS